MKIRVKTLWRVPIYCTIASVLSYYFTIYTARFFFIVKTVGADGVTELSIDPVRSTIFHTVLFVIILLLGGLWAFRSMTKPEIAVSAVLLSALYLMISLAQIYIPNFPLKLSINLAQFQEWYTILSSIMLRLTDNFNFSVLIADLAPFLFIPFGKKSTS